MSYDSMIYKVIYDLVKHETAGLDSVYEDYLVAIVGWAGVAALLQAGLLESCGVINGRRLFVLCDWPKS